MKTRSIKTHKEFLKNQPHLETPYDICRHQVYPTTIFVTKHCMYSFIVKVFCFAILLLCTHFSHAQYSANFLEESRVFESKKLNVQPLTTSDTLFNKGKLYRRLALHSGIWVTSYIGLYHAWYKGYPQSGFHFFDDSKEWLQIDKGGHMLTGYFLAANQLIPSYQRAGLTDKKAILLGASVTWSYQAMIEILDGFSAEWGASATDLAANTFGAGLAVFQALRWKEQRIFLKGSSYPKSYRSLGGEFQSRADKLYGTSLPEKMLKDYNAATVWATVSPMSFINKNSKLVWLGVAVGMGAEGMFGGFENKWENDGVFYDRSNIKRYRQWFLSPDIDFTRIPIKWPIYRKLAPWFNLVKFPLPTLELSQGKLKIHAIYF